MGSYVLSVAAAAVILGIASSFLNPKSSAGSFVKLIGGLYLTIVVIQPVVNFDLEEISSFLDDFTLQGEPAVTQGSNIARQEVADIIKSETEAYILDKAGLYREELTVAVELSDEQIPVPQAVTICGILPAYARLSLQNMMENELNIPKENQTWIGMP